MMPPPHAVPRDMAPPLAPQCDLREDYLTQEQLREKLSHYYVVRMEKAEVETFDDFGNLIGPTWNNIIRSQVYDMSNQQAAWRVRELDLERSVSDKKASLITAQQRQLEMIQAELTKFELNPKYQTVLVQLDHQLKEIKEPYAYYYKQGKHGKEVLVTHKQSKSKKKPRYRRQSITAFFKRMPREGENLRMMWHERQAERSLRDHPPMLPPQFQQMQPGPPQQGQQGQQGPAQPGGRQMQGGGRPGGMKMPQGVQVLKDNGKKPMPKHKRDQSPGSYSSSSGSRSYSDSEGTPPTSLSSDSRRRHRGRSRSRSRSRHRVRDRPEFYGHDAPRRHSRGEYVLDAPPMFPQVPQPPLIDPEAAIESAFARGLDRGFEMADAERRVQPRVIVEERLIDDRVPVRHITAREAQHLRRDDELDRRMNRLTFDDDSAYSRYDEPTLIPVPMAARPIRHPVYGEEDIRYGGREARAQRILAERERYHGNPFERLPRF